MLHQPELMIQNYAKCSACSQGVDDCETRASSITIYDATRQCPVSTTTLKTDSTTAVMVEDESCERDSGWLA